MHRIRVIDTHTGGEPTRVVVAGGPDLGSGSLAERRDQFRERFDQYRSAIVNEPRGSDVMVGALLTPPVDPRCAAGVIFFNNVGCLGMCGHGTIGAVIALAHAGKLTRGEHRLETPVGIVAVEYDGGHRVSLVNVPSRRTLSGVQVEVAGQGLIAGDVAWGGNWFFLANAPAREEFALDLAHAPALTELAWSIRRALTAAGVTGDGGAEIDHIELFGPPVDSQNHSRSFVLCPGGAYDRSPCGTGTSAKLACLAAAGKLRPGEVWRQESVIGSVFEGRYELAGNEIIPHIAGTAFVTAEAELLLDPADPCQWGIRG